MPLQRLDFGTKKVTGFIIFYGNFKLIKQCAGTCKAGGMMYDVPLETQLRAT